MLQVGHVPSHEQVADVLTKPLVAGSFYKFQSQLRVTTRDDPRRECSSMGNVRNSAQSPKVS